MQVEIAVVADAANVSQEGKLNITGIFDNITTAAMPMHWPFFVLVLRLRAMAGEKGRNQIINVILIDQDGKTIHRLPEVQLQLPSDAPGTSGVIPLVFGVANLEFQSFGEYRFEILLNGNQIKGIPLTITQRRE